MEPSETRLQVRAGWLVRTWRESSSDVGLRVQRRLSERLHQLDPDVRIDPPRLSRVETGRARPQLAWLALVEQALDVPANLLVATVDGLYRDDGVVLAPARPAESASWMHRVHEALETIASDRAPGAAWYELARLLEGSGRLVYLPPDERRRLAERLVSEMPRSTGLARVQRVQAIRALLTTRVLGQDLRRAIAASAAEPHAQGLGDLVARLREDDGAHSRRLLARLLRHPRPEVRTVVAEDAHRPPASIPPGPRPGLAAAVRAEVAGFLVRVGQVEDVTLGLLVGDALGLRGAAAATEARAVLAASPWRPVLAAHAADRAVGGSSFAPPWLRLVGETGTRRQLEVVARLAAHPSPAVHRSALAAVSRLPVDGADVSRAWDGSAGSEDAVSAALLRALGMTGHPRLRFLADDAEQAAAVRGAARWWLRTGPAVRDIG